MKRQLSLWLVLFGIVGIGTSNLSAGAYSGSFTAGNVKATWSAYPTPGTQPLAIPCPGGGNCGYAKQPYGTGYSSLAPTGSTTTNIGWHSYSSGSVVSYLDGLIICTANCPTTGQQSLSFSLSGNAGLTSGPSGTNPVINLFREPTNDAGYYLYTPGASTITIAAPSGQYFKAFDFYWGSVDPWNSITFNPTGGSCTGTNVCTTVYGTSLSASGFVINDPTHSSLNAPNTSSATIDFTPVSGQANWRSVTFSACSSPSDTNLHGACFPAFELDNLQFVLSTKAVGGPIQTPVPEPSSLLLLGTGIAGIAALLRRSLRP